MILEIEILDENYINQKEKEYFDPSERDMDWFYLTYGKIENINETGQLLIKALDSEHSFWVDANSPRIHPCGTFSNYNAVYSTSDVSYFFLRTF